VSEVGPDQAVTVGPDQTDRATTLNRSRFALSPLAETVSVHLALHRGDVGTNDPAQFRRRRDEFRSWTAADPTARGLFALCGATKFLPDLVALPPTGMGTRIADELSRVAAWTDTATRATLQEAASHSWAAQDLSWTRQPEIAGQIARVLEQGWNQFVAPDWPRRQAILERDVMFRAGILAVCGWHDAIHSMTRKIRWHADDAIEFSTQAHADRTVGDAGLVFVPHTGTRSQWTCEAPPRFALVYPASGTGIIDQQPHDALETLLGLGRAGVLLQLQRPGTSSQLAVTLGLSLGTISGHLAKLHNAGVITKARTKHAVYYTLTPSGQRLIEALQTAQPQA